MAGVMQCDVRTLHVLADPGAALAALAGLLREWNWPLIDGQVENPHLSSLGAFTLPRGEFLQQVALLRDQAGVVGSWTALAGERGIGHVL